jgi:thymidine kinase
MSREPVFKIFTGPMFGSKTTQMLACIDRYRYQSKSCVAFKPKMDDRYDVDKIQTHSGLSIEALCVKTGKEILDAISKIEKNEGKKVDVVAVDEAFMIEGSSNALIEIYRSGVNVIVASIQMSFLGNPFHEIKEIMPWATHISVCPAVCPKTGADAYYTYKKMSDENEVDVGGSEMYEPRCLSQHSLIKKGRT